jgi:ABC-type transport system involved in multi-copper enzyme maturation permease subunit
LIFEEKFLLIFVAAAILSFMIFFPLVVATSVFKVLDENQSSKFLRIFFPKYYLFGFVLSFFGIILSTFEKNNISLLVFSFIMLGFLFSRQILMPMINKAKDENIDNKFNKLHKFSVFINFVQMIASVFLLVMYLK